MIQYQTFELHFKGPEPEGSQSIIDLKAEFTCQGITKEVEGFYAGKGSYIVRYLPQGTGTVSWKVSGLFQEEGEEECLPCGDGIHHGLVKPAGTALRYEDGTDCRPFGTTIYAMMHQPKDLIAQTIQSVLESPLTRCVPVCFRSITYLMRTSRNYLLLRRMRREDLIFIVPAMRSGMPLRRCCALSAGIGWRLT